MITMRPTTNPVYIGSVIDVLASQNMGTQIPVNTKSKFQSRVHQPESCDDVTNHWKTDVGDARLQSEANRLIKRGVLRGTYSEGKSPIFIAPMKNGLTRTIYNEKLTYENIQQRLRYTYQYLPMGLYTSPETYHTKVSRRLKNMEYVQNYVDDIVITMVRPL